MILRESRISLGLFYCSMKAKKNVALLVVGGGEMEDAIRALVEKSGNSAIILAGKVSPDMVSEYYALMDMVVYPRKSTRITEMTTPLKPLEAMALGKPVICSNVGGLKELVGEGNGLFFSPGSKDQLNACIKRLMHDPGFSLCLGEAGRRRALEARSWRNLIRKYEDVYTAATTRRKRHKKKL